MSLSTGRLIGQPVEVVTFQEFESNEVFDGVWACASLLHVPSGELDMAIRKLAACTRDRGTMYMSFKLGSGERVSRGRLFTDMNHEGLVELLKLLPELRLKESWTTSDQRPGRAAEKWFNALLVKQG